MRDEGCELALNMVGELCEKYVTEYLSFRKKDYLCLRRNRYVQEGDTTRAQNVSILPTVDKLP